ncbi:MAG: flagellar biosynthesis protein FlhA [Planctomycetota bacterium]
MTEFLNTLQEHIDVIIVLWLVAILLIIFVPLPTYILDFLLVINITFSFLMLLVSIYVREPLGFSVMPSLLLITTAYRLSLNIASTRLILSNAKELGDLAAGKVISTFGNFVAGNSPAIGFVIFIIIFIVQFIVITKGANRISEVSARFILDALPGKQMGIDAELSAGIITAQQAQEKRQRLTQEADFYGAMDGAAKFIRGDAIASIVIALVNIIGGVVIGIFKYGMTISQTFGIFTKLTIGDGLVSQIPALMISLGAGLLITRSSLPGKDFGKDVISQTIISPKVLIITLAFLILLITTPLPKLQLITIALVVGLIAYFMTRRQLKETEHKSSKAPPSPHEQIENLLKVEPLELEIGLNLISLVDTTKPDNLLERISSLRRQIAIDNGFIVPPIRIRDNILLEPSQYVIKIRGSKVGSGELRPGYLLAFETPQVKEKIEGIPTTDPAFGTPAIWLKEELKDEAQKKGYVLIEPTAVLITHLSEVIKQNAPEILTREALHDLLQTFRQTHRQLIEETIPAQLKVSELHRILQNLLYEGVPIRDLPKIIEAASEYRAKTNDLLIIGEYVRQALARQITEKYLEKDKRLYVITISPDIEKILKGVIEISEGNIKLNLDPNLLKQIIQSIANALQALVKQNHLPIVLVDPQIRLGVKKLCEYIQSNIVVLSYAEIPRNISVESVAVAQILDKEYAKNT